MTVNFLRFSGNAGSAAIGTTTTTIYTVPTGKVAKIILQDALTDAGTAIINYHNLTRGTTSTDATYDTSTLLKVGTQNILGISSVGTAVATIVTVANTIDNATYPDRVLASVNSNGAVASAWVRNPIISAGESVAAISVRGHADNSTPTINYSFLVIEDDA